MSSRNAVVLLSGGIDSTACTHFLLKQGLNVSALYVDHGQAARAYEARSARQICKYFNIKLHECAVRADTKFEEGELQGRNAFLIFSALLFSQYTNCLLAIGIHSGTKYYDCSPGFLDRVRGLVTEYTGGQFDVIAPFITWTKHEIISYCVSEKIPIELTYSCERGTHEPCGECTSCRDREGLVYVSCA